MKPIRHTEQIKRSSPETIIEDFSKNAKEKNVADPRTYQSHVSTGQNGRFQILKNFNWTMMR